MDNAKLFHDIKDVIIDWLVPYTKHGSPLGGCWNHDSSAGFYWYCGSQSSRPYSFIGTCLCDNGDIEIWTNNKENVNIRIYYNDEISNEPIVSHNTDSKYDDFSEDDIKNLYDKIKEYLEKNKELVSLSNEEKGYGKIVENLTIDDLRKYEDAGISILLVRKPLTPEVSEAVGKSKMHVYADLDPETINAVRDVIAAAGNVVRHLIAGAGGNSNE